MTNRLAPLTTAFALVSGLAAAQPVPTDTLEFVGIVPCRVLDTRGNGFTGTYGQPSLVAGARRDFKIAGQCGIPADAEAVSTNLGVTLTQGAGFIQVFPAGGTLPVVSSLNYEHVGQTIANAAVIPLGADGSITVVAGVAATEFFLDVNGYYASQAEVTSLNGMSGVLTLEAGTNVTLTPGASSISIAATGTAGPTGAQGPAGPQGLQGIAGPDGPQGALGPQGIQGIQGTQGIQGLIGAVGATWRDAWDSATPYAINDLVSLDGSTYIALVANSNSSPDAVGSTDWSLVAAKGDTGIQGIQGNTGGQGIQGIQGNTGGQGIQGIQGNTGGQGIQGPAGGFSGTFTVRTISFAVATTLLATDQVVIATATGGSTALRTLTLPSVSVPTGQMITIKNKAAAQISVAGFAAAEGGPLSLNGPGSGGFGPYSALNAIFDGTSWWVLGLH